MHMCRPRELRIIRTNTYSGMAFRIDHMCATSEANVPVAENLSKTIMTELILRLGKS